MQKVEVEVTDEEKARLERIANRPSLSEILNLHDFEVGRIFTLESNAIILSVTQAIAKVVMPDKAWVGFRQIVEDGDLIAGRVPGGQGGRRGGERFPPYGLARSRAD